MLRCVLIAFVLLSLTPFAVSANEVATKQYLMGQFVPKSDPRFVLSGSLYLRRETFQAFWQMKNEAARDGINLRIVSATRTFAQQKTLWENKWRGRAPVNSDTREFLPRPGTRFDTLTLIDRASRILEFTAMPAASRHHWGTDLDFNDVNPSYWETPRGQREYRWLVENAPRFGFCQVYSANRTTGYKEEKWHWSYLPVARELTRSFAELITDEHLSVVPFVGSTSATEIKAIENFVLGIDESCK